MYAADREFDEKKSPPVDTAAGGLGERPLRLTSDLVFKAVYGRDTPECKKALISILNIILDRKEMPIVDLLYRNPFNYAEYPDAKMIIMEIKAVTDTGQWMGIEMQVEDAREMYRIFEKMAMAEGEKLAAIRGQTEGEERLARLMQKLLGENRIEDLHQIAGDAELRQKLYKEYGI